MLLAYLGKPKEESQASNLAPILRRSHKRSESAPDKTQPGEEDTRPDSSENHVRWDFEYKIGDEECQNNDRVLRRCQSKVAL